MSQRSIRFPDDLEALIQAEADRLDRSFSWVVIKELESALRVDVNSVTFPSATNSASTVIAYSGPPAKDERVSPTGQPPAPIPGVENIARPVDRASAFRAASQKRKP